VITVSALNKLLLTLTLLTSSEFPIVTSDHECVLYAVCILSGIIVKKLNSLKHLVRTTLAESHN